MSARRLRALLEHELRRRRVVLGAAVKRALVRAARGRPGWIVRACELSSDPRYWRDGNIRVAALCDETELVLRAAEGWLVDLIGNHNA